MSRSLSLFADRGSCPFSLLVLLKTSLTFRGKAALQQRVADGRTGARARGARAQRELWCFVRVALRFAEREREGVGVVLLPNAESDRSGRPRRAVKGREAPSRAWASRSIATTTTYQQARQPRHGVPFPETLLSPSFLSSALRERGAFLCVRMSGTVK